MAGTYQGVEAGRAFVRLFGDDSDLEKTLKGARVKLRAFAGAVGTIGRSMMVAGALIGAPLVAATKQYADFSQQMASVATMLDRPAEFMGRYATEIKRMSVEFGEGTDTISKGLYQILSASVAPSKALGVLEASLRAAKAGMSDTYIAADAITTIMNSFGMAAERATEISDWMFQVIRRGKTTFAELAPSIGLVAAPAAQVGVSLEQLGATISALTRAGIQTEVVMTGLMNMMKSFLKPGDEAAAAARLLGFEMNTATMQSMGLVGVLKRLSQIDTETVGEVLPNMRALRVGLAGVQNIKGVLADLALQYNNAGSTQAAFEKITDNLKFRMDQLWQSIHIAAVNIGEKLAPTAESLVHTMRNLAESLGNVSAGLVTGAANAALLATGLGAALLVVSKLASAISMMLSPVGLIVTAVVAALALIGYGVYKLVDALTTSRAEMEETAREADTLVARYKELVENTDRTAQQSLELESVMARLKQLFPDLADKIDGTAESWKNLERTMGGGRAGVGIRLEAEREALKDLGEEWEGIQIRIGRTKEILDRMQPDSPGRAGIREELLNLYNWEQKISADMEAAMLRIRAYRRMLAPVGGETPGGAAAGAAGGEPPPPIADLAAIDKLEHDVWQKVAEARARAMEDEMQGEIELVRLRYDKEIQEASASVYAQIGLEEVKQREIEAIRKKYAEKAAEEEKRKAEKQADYEADVYYDLAREKIRAALDGIEEERALLILEMNRALQEAQEAGAGKNVMAAIRETYALRMRALDATGQGVSSRGTFSGMSLWGFGVGDSTDRMTKATEKTAEEVKNLNQWLQSRGMLVFTPA